MDTIELNELLNAETETEILEFKKAERQFDKDKLGRYFSALSNEANLYNKKYAWILLGVLNDKTTFGTSISDKQLNEYKSEISNHTSPTLNFIKTERIITENGNVIMLQIPAAPKGQPVSWKGHYYGRDGESLGALNSEEYDRIRNQTILIDWSAQIISKATIQDLSSEAILKAREQFAEKNPKLREAINSWDDITFLNKAKITIKDKITNTTVLLLGKGESEHFLSPAVAKMSWILKDRDNISKDYEHFNCPFLITAPQLRNKIRNLKYRYIKDESLFPVEVDSYDPYVIREALNNCIAHQDYTLGGKINVVEREDSKLIFLNKGAFIPITIDNVLSSDAPEIVYRNKFLANAMVNLNMIDTIGSGIVKMFNVQRKKFFPLPDYNFDNNSVQVTIDGKVLDISYASKLASVPNLSLQEIILLDKIQKGKAITASEAKELKTKKLIEGKRPNLYISSEIAKATGEKETYIKQRGIDDEYCQKIIIDYLRKFKEGNKSDFEKILINKLPDVLDVVQKKNKIKNNLQYLRRNSTIETKGKLWIMSKTT